MNTAQWLDMMDEIAPLSSQEAWDNSGLQIDLGNAAVDRILVAMEVTGDVIEEAITKNANMIVVHHPLIFNAIKNVTATTLTGDYIIRLVRAGVAVYASHTCFDAARMGNNEYLMSLLNVQRVSRLNMPGKGFEYSSMARVGILERPMLLSEFTEKLSSVLGNPGGIKVSGEGGRLVHKVAVCTGGGGEFYEGAIACGADVFISGDIKHHEAQAAKESGLCIIDAGHFGTEHIFVKNMAELIRRRSDGSLTVMESAADQNPYNRVI